MPSMMAYPSWTKVSDMDYSKAVAAVEQYMVGLEGDDVQVILDLYAEDAQVEDPIGSDLVVGHEALATFYNFALGSITKASLTGPVRLAASEAAFSFTLQLGDDSDPTYMDIIDVFKFNEEGKVISMRAFWGAENMRKA